MHPRKDTLNRVVFYCLFHLLLHKVIIQYCYNKAVYDH